MCDIGHTVFYSTVPVTSLTDTPHATDREPYLSSTCNEETGSDDAVFKAWTLTSPLLVASLAPPPPQQQRTPNLKPAPRRQVGCTLHEAAGRSLTSSWPRASWPRPSSGRPSWPRASWRWAASETAAACEKREKRVGALGGRGGRRGERRRAHPGRWRRRRATVWVWLWAAGVREPS